MSTTQTTSTGTTKPSVNGGKPERKKPVRLPRTEQDKALAICQNALKRVPEAMRPNVLRALNALYGT